RFTVAVDPRSMSSHCSRSFPTSFVSLLVGLVGLPSTSPAYSWGSKGHEIIAAIAETQLTDTARKRIKELLRKGRR
ncbi:MAG TPA: hypothetical protein VIR01_12720, partial [Pyrinomonadaceae bacterium]